MKSKKIKIFALMLALIMVFTLAACGDNSGGNNTPPATTPSQPQQGDNIQQSIPVLPAETQDRTSIQSSNSEFEYTIFDGSEITITKYIGGAGDVNIPAEIDGVPVTVIGSRAFSGIRHLTSVTIPDSVTSIEGNAFGGNGNLTSVTIGNGVTSIVGNAFEGNENLTSVTIGNSVTSIGDFAFANCPALASIVIPDSVTSIGAHAFLNCFNLTSVTIGNSVTDIGEGAFDSTALISVVIPSSVTNIGSRAFRGRGNSLISAYFEGSAPRMGTDVFQRAASDFTIYHRADAQGWSNPWHGYPTATY